ncbi:hypothetical protein MMC17_004975 [Xylographa soralifera]|nr:hypothetical protein [Xylographa soralifera]
MDSNREPAMKINMVAPMYGPAQARKTFVLCFDGTGNKFSGTASDSNILKIFRMLDRNDPSHLHYYQAFLMRLLTFAKPGIGTYVDTKQMSAHTSLPARFNSWFQKAKDSAIGTSFDEHVMGGYKFLMRYYSTDIYFFGFSRGAYIARFLAEMLDYVGLLSAGNEEMARFAWKAFAKWQQRHGESEKNEAKKKKMFEFIMGFRETFSRPVRRIRFLGLFDTVNSVPHFENAWMKRSKFPYTARSSALVIRHAVCIDERRAKFRQDLISEMKRIDITHRHYPHNHVDHHLQQQLLHPTSSEKPMQHHDHLELPQKKIEAPRAAMPSERYRRPSHHRLSLQHERGLSISPARSLTKLTEGDEASIRTASSQPVSSQMSLRPPPREIDDDEDEDASQDIQELWFPGCHAVSTQIGDFTARYMLIVRKDIGGGWDMSQNEKVPLSHGPLVWMVREAQKAGLQFDADKLRSLSCIEDPSGESVNLDLQTGHIQDQSIPQVQVTGAESPDVSKPINEALSTNADQRSLRSAFHQALIDSATTSTLHDCLIFGGGLKAGGVLWWNFMEYLPFRRMDLQPDNSWKSISWPLPKGEVRDIPEGALIHHSALRRMESNEDYRPGNLIIGGGGRGVRKAPKELGMGSWEVVHEEGDLVGEVVVRRKRVSEEKEDGEE